MVTVLFFGSIAELTGTDQLQVDGCNDTVALQQSLIRQFPEIGSRKFAVAVNKAVVHQNTPLAQGSEVAILPPFAGG